MAISPPAGFDPGARSVCIPELTEHPATPIHSDDDDSSSSCSSRSSASVHQESVRVFTGLSREAVAAASVPNASGYESPTESSQHLQQYPFPLAAAAAATACDLQLQQTRSRRGDIGPGPGPGTIMTLEPVGDGTHILTTTRSRRASNRHGGGGGAAERRRASHASGVQRAGHVFGADGAAALRRMASIETAVEDGSSDMEATEKKDGWAGLRHDLIRRICSHKWTWFTMVRVLLSCLTSREEWLTINSFSRQW